MRRTEPHCTQLTARDAQLLQKLHAAGWLTTEQIGAYFFSGKSLNAVSKRLRKLVRAGYLADARVSSTEQKFYRLAGRGHRMLLEQTKTDDIIRYPSQLPHKLRHFTVVNDLRLAFDRAFPSAALALHYFHAEREYPWVGRQPRHPLHGLLAWLAQARLIPDAIAGLQIAGHHWDLALEYDAGTEPAHFFGRAKMQQYLDCLAHDPDTFEHFKILVIAPTLKRLLHLMRQTALVQPARGQFFFALLGKFQHTAWPQTAIFLDPTELFAVAWDGETRTVIETLSDQETLPKHSLQSLLTGSPANLSLREERQSLPKGKEQNDFPPPLRAHY